ncbi:SLC13 family permease [Marimonas arenosa]|uniref:DASS family sodium-coupled anion symporter n=1 Tax=Marimonas arenosa TaxID=1795305 RepID=A0AAE4B483_9RHOB|nr:DASS family sodium-coupled anion symporter [Marimonas arenosa]MDQ2089962.1 DASS family sodium-coupled anion symporter [Marimonas arenosa]
MPGIRGWIMLAGLSCLGAVLVLPAPEGLSPQGWRVSGLAALMALWWVSEAVPLAATALLPLALAPLLQIAELGEVAGAYSDPLILLFLGGFLLARAIEHWHLHRRIARGLIGLAGQQPGRVLAAVMLATAFLSLWISNTASAMVMAPIAAGVAQGREPRFAAALLLGVAFSATIGGIGSLIGTPPNAIFAAYSARVLEVQVGFAEWAAVGMPVALVLLVCAWGVLALATPGLRDVAALDLPAQAGPGWSRGERRLAILAGFTAALWIARPFLERVWPDLPLSDAGIAMAAAVLLFALPAGQGGRLLDWDTAKGLRWDILILVGGGLALAGLMDGAGLVDWIGDRVSALEGLPVVCLVLVIAALIVGLGELASNTAMAAIFLPVAGAVAQAMGVEPMQIVLPVALAASVGFMLPVATPPNAIVFGHDAVNRTAMLKAGAPLDLIGVVVAAGLGLLLGPLVF